MPHLPPPTGMSHTAEEQIKNRWDTIQSVQDRLAEKGIIVSDVPPPFPIPEVSSTLVDTNNQEYLQTNAKYLAWLNYIMPQIALNEGMALQAKNEKSNIEAVYRTCARGADEGKAPKDRQSKEEVADSILLDPRYIELTQFEQEMAQERRVLEEKKEELTRVLRVISRHIEVKKLDAEMNRTSSNLPQRRPFTRTGFGGDQ